MNETNRSFKDSLKEFLETSLKKVSYPAGSGFAWEETGNVSYESAYSLLNKFGEQHEVKFSEYDADDGTSTDTWSRLKADVGESKYIMEIYCGNGVVKVTVV